MINEKAFQIRKDGKPKADCFCTRPWLIENYEEAMNDKTQTWECHHRLEIAPFSGKHISHKRLIELGMYFNVEPEALIFLTETEHKKLEQGKEVSAETREKLSKQMKGKKFSDEHKKHLSDSSYWKGKPAWNKGKSSALKGRHLVYDENGRRHYIK